MRLLDVTLRNINYLPLMLKVSIGERERGEGREGGRERERGRDQPHLAMVLRLLQLQTCLQSQRQLAQSQPLSLMRTGQYPVHPLHTLHEAEGEEDDGDEEYQCSSNS